MSDLPDGTVTFLFSDIEGSTDLTRKLGAEFARVRAAVREVHRDALDAHDGHEIDTEGDGFFAAFARPSQAVVAAVEVQRALSTTAWPHDARVAVRIAIHTTEPFRHEDGYTGVGVSRAARICAVANGGQIVVSAAAAGIVEDVGVEGVRLRDVGEHRLKDLVSPQRLFVVDAAGLDGAQRALRVVGGGRSVGTLFAADLAGFRSVMLKVGDDRAAVVVAAYHDLILEAVERHGGRLLERAGDWTLSLFPDARDAVVAADAARASLAEQRWPEFEDAPVMRAAVFTGRIADPDARMVGTAAMHARRLCSRAIPGQVLVSATTQALLEGQALAPLAVRDAGVEENDGDATRRVFELVRV